MLAIVSEQSCDRNSQSQIMGPRLEATGLLSHQYYEREYLGCKNGVLVETYILGRTKILKVTRPEFRQQTMTTLAQSSILGVTAKAKGDMVGG